ncbi:unnamed protein product, partial [marine sediment metagenome]
MRVVPHRLIVLFGAFVPWIAGCEPPEKQKIDPPEVTVALPEQRDVVDFAEFTGRTETTELVEIRARVQGFLEGVDEYSKKKQWDPPQTDFTEGTIVTQDQLLFVIEPEPFEVTLASTKAKLAQAEAAYRLAESNLNRSKPLLASKAISEEDFQARWAERDAAWSQVQREQADISQAEIDLGYTMIYAPFEGLIGRRLVDPGNLVGAGENTLLTTLVRLDPMYVYFDVSEPVVLRYLKFRQEREDQPRADEQAKAEMGTADDEGFPHQGHLDFLDNRIDPSTGTALIRGVFPNPDHTLYPGLFVRVRIPLDTQQSALLVDERAIQTDLGGKYVLVVDDKNFARPRYLDLGSLQDDGMRVIRPAVVKGDKTLKGLLPEERYIIKGTQRA